MSGVTAATVRSRSSSDEAPEYADDDPAIAADHIDPSWTIDDLRDMHSDAAWPSTLIDAVEAYREEAASWRVELDASRAYLAAHRNPSSDELRPNVPLTNAEMQAKALRNRKRVFTFDTLVEACLPPELRLGAGPEAIAEAMMQVKTVELDSMWIEDIDVLECLGDVTHLDLSNNLVRSLLSLEVISSLRVLIVSDNFITSLMPIAALELEFLDARRNRIAVIEEEGLCTLPVTLQRCFLDGNPCTAADNFMDVLASGCPVLMFLDEQPVPWVKEAVTPSSPGTPNVASPDAEQYFDAETGGEDDADRRGAPAARYSFPVGDSMFSNVRTMTDDLLGRYTMEMHAKLNALAHHRSGGDGRIRPLDADVVPAPSGLVSTPTKPHAARSFAGTSATNVDEDDPLSESGSDDPDVETGAVHGQRTHAEAAIRQTELHRELRFAMSHQCNVARGRLSDLWDEGEAALSRTSRDNTDGDGHVIGQAGAAYTKVIQYLKGYTGDRTLDKYRIPPRHPPVQEQQEKHRQPEQ